MLCRTRPRLQLTVSSGSHRDVGCDEWRGTTHNFHIYRFFFPVVSNGHLPQACQQCSGSDRCTMVHYGKAACGGGLPRVEPYMGRGCRGEGDNVVKESGGARPGQGRAEGVVLAAIMTTATGRLSSPRPNPKLPLPLTLSLSLSLSLSLLPWLYSCPRSMNFLIEV